MQIGQGRTRAFQIVKARTDVALESRQVGIVDAQPREHLGRLFVRALLVETQGFFGLALVFLIQVASPGKGQALRTGEIDPAQCDGNHQQARA